jgi:hypothetical protein
LNTIAINENHIDKKHVEDIERNLEDFYQRKRLERHEFYSQIPSIEEKNGNEFFNNNNDNNNNNVVNECVVISSNHEEKTDLKENRLYSDPPILALPQNKEEENDANNNINTIAIVTAEKFSHATDLSPTPTTIKQTRVRVSIIGFSETFDTWLDIESTRIQPLNTFSCGRRGEGIIREEILYFVNMIPAKNDFDINHAVWREGSFVEKEYVRMVNAFGSFNGFEKINELIQNVTHNRIVYNILNVYTLIIIVGNMNRVLSKSFLNHNTDFFITACSHLLLFMNTSYMRQSPVEMIESVLNAVELIAYTFHGRNEVAGRVTEELRLSVALQNLVCPYLNRRLGGLKILIDVIRRAESSVDYPSGLKTFQNFTNGIQYKSYRVVPVFYYLKLSTICTKLEECDAILQIFEGGNAHESLMARASFVLCAMARNGNLSERLLNAVWDAGFVEKKTEALKSLVEVIAYLNIASMNALFLKATSKVDDSAVTTNLVDVVAALATRCKKTLMDRSLEFFNKGFQNNKIDEKYMKDHIISYDSVTDQVESQIEGNLNKEEEEYVTDDLLFNYEVYLKTTTKLWNWLEDKFKTSEAVISQCILKLEKILEVGISSSVALNDESFSWAMHWFRMKILVYLAVDAIVSGSSLIHALRILNICVSTWPYKQSTLTAKAKIQEFLIFCYPSRADLVQFLESRYQITVVITKAIIDLKTNFVDYVSTKYSTQKINSQTAIDSEITLNNCRHTYKEQVTKLLEFLHSFVNCDDDLSISKEIVSDIWNCIVCHNITTQQECDACISFLSKLIWKPFSTNHSNNNSNGYISNNNAILPSEQTIDTNNSCSIINTSNISIAEPSSPPPATVSSVYKARNCACDRQTIEWIFVNLLSNPSSTSFIRSRFYSLKAFNCTEKWFKWLNAEYNNISESSDLNNKSIPFIINVSPSSLIGISAFEEIILHCEYDNVANNAVKFLTSFPQYLSQALKASGEIYLFRNNILLRSMQELEYAQNNPEKVNLNRVLSLLDGILEESLANSEFKINPHGSIGKGDPIEFKLNSTTKRLKAHCKTITLYTNDTLEDLMNAIANQFRTPINDLKVFRSSREITSLDFKKTISQLKFLSEQESVIVSEKQSSNISSNGNNGGRRRVNFDIKNDVQKLFALATNKANSSAIAPIITFPPININNESKEPVDEKNEIVVDNNTVASSIVASAVFANVIAITMNRMKEVETAKLPAVILSNSNSYFGLLFSLLKTNHNDVCDKMWRLIIRLPTNSIIQNEWLQLNLNSVYNLLFSFFNRDNNNNNIASATTSYHNLSELLYNLQIIEMFIQPTKSVQEFNNQKNSFGLINVDLLSTWVQRFIEKKGFQALCEANKWVFEVLQLYIHQNFVLNGVTPSLLLQTIGLLSKLTRAFLLKICFVSCTSEKFLPILKWINKEYNNNERKKVNSPDNNNYNSTTDDVRVVDLTEEEEKNSQQNIVETNALWKQWGWNIVIDINNVDIAMQNIDFVSIQYLTVSSMILLRQLCSHTEFSSTQSCSVVEFFSNCKVKYPVSVDSVITILHDLLDIWGCVAVSDLSILNNICRFERDDDGVIVDVSKNPPKINSVFLLKELLLGDFDGNIDEKNSNGNNKRPVGHSIGDWFVNALLTFLNWITQPHTKNKNHYTNLVNYESKQEFELEENLIEFKSNHFEDDENTMNEFNNANIFSNEFRRQIFLSLLDLRPSLINDQNEYDNNSVFQTNNTIKLNKKTKLETLFALASSLLDVDSSVNHSNATLHSIPVQVRIHVCEQIFEELRMAAVILKTEKNESFQYIEGNMKLLTALFESIRDEKKTMGSLMSKKNLHFVLTDCLGLVNIEQSLQPIICVDDSSRLIYIIFYCIAITIVYLLNFLVIYC